MLIQKSASTLRVIAKTTGTTFRAQTDPTINLARLLVEFATTHFLLNAATLDELTETTNGVLNGFIFS